MATCDDYMVQCPYDRSHVIRRSRIQQHIVKCERNFPGLVMEWCPHNASHRFACHEDYVAHVPNCPDARINSNVLIMMAMKYHEMGDMCKKDFDPSQHVGSDTEDWAAEYCDSSRCEDTSSSSSGIKVNERQPDTSNSSSGRASWESEEGEIDNVINEVATLNLNSEVSILGQIVPYSSQGTANPPLSAESNRVDMSTPKSTSSLIERKYLKGICIGRGHRLPWIDGKPGKATYQKSLESNGLASEGEEKSVGRGFSRRSSHSKEHFHSLRKPSNSCLSGW